VGTYRDAGPDLVSFWDLRRLEAGDDLSER